MGDAIQLFCIVVWVWLRWCGNGFVVSYCLFCELWKFLHFILSVAVAHVFDGFGTISYGGHAFVGMGDGGFCYILVAKLGSVGEPLAIGCFDVAKMCAVVL